jgi:ParB family chromosome partitioning protein
VKLRHDIHFVEELGSRYGSPIGHMIPIDQIDPNPNQPRQQMGDLSELTASVREKGILEPLIVRRRGNRYQIISGERRYQAALQAKLTEIPCVERDVDDREIVEIALVENLQRKDLTPFEEAEAMSHLVSQYNYKHEELAKKIGKSRSSITEMLTLANMPEEIKKLCQLADIASKSLLLQIVRQDNPEKMIGLIEQISREGLSRDQARKITRPPKKGRPKHYVFKYGSQTTPYRLQISFRKSRVDKDEVIQALKRILKELESS